MAVEMKKIIPFARKGLLVSIRASYKFTKDHPFISGFVFFVLSLYRCFPSLFAFLVSSSPVIFCTAFLLGLLLSYGEPNIPEVDEEDKKTQEVRSLKATCATDNLVIKKDEIFAVETHVEQRREINEDPIEATTLIEGDVNASGNVESYAYSVISHYDGERQDDALTASSSLFKEDEKEIHGEKKVDEDDYQGQVVNREFSAANSDQIPFADGEDVIHAPSKGQSKFEAPQIKIDEPALGNHFASSLGSPYQHIERHDASSDSESDRAESSSPDASMADILPMLDELHPLLYSEHPQHAHKDIDTSDAASQSSSDESESLDSGAEEEAENQGQAEDERQEERDDATEVAVKWTADDQKNIMDLGILELERNQRLENLIAKRRARKRLEAERNRINLDIDDIDPVMQQLRGLHIETRPIRRNPFDLPDDSEESMGLPPIPGSAPSNLLPRWNPFDFSDDPIGETGGLTSQKMSHRKEFAPLSQREMFFRKHDSFSMEPLFSVDSTQEKPTSRFRPAESMDSDQSYYATLQRHISANSDSKVNYVPEFDSVSSVDQENKELAKQVYYDQSELLGPVDHRGEPSDLGSQSSEKIDLIDGKQEPGGINIVEDNRIGSDAAGAIEGAPPVAGAVDEEIRHNDLPMLHVSEADHLHEIKEKFNDSRSSSSSEVTDKVLDMSINEVSATVERTGSLGDSRDSTHSAFLDYNNMSSKVERLDESQVANCIFYSSPSATEESLYNVAALNSELFFGGKEGSYSSSLASDLQVEISEIGSPPRPTEMNVISEGEAFVFNHRSTGEDSTSGSQDISVNFAEENDSVPREESMIREHDVIRMVYPEADIDFSDSVISMVPEPAAVQLVHGPNLSSEVNGQKDSPVDVEASLECDLSESISSTSYPEAHECLRNPTDRIDLEEFQPSVLDLPPIPENLHESILEHEHDSSEEPAPMVSFTGLQLFEEYNVDPYDLQEELSSPQPQSPKENRIDVNSKSLIHDLEESDALISSPGVSFSDSSFSGLYAVNQSEIRDDSETRGSSGSICSEMESGEVHNELKDLKEIDEDLLSELDVVGDFYAAKPTLNQELSGMELPFVSDGIGRVESCEDKSLEVSHLSSKLPAETMDETKLVVEQPTLTILEMDPEQTVYKSKLHVLEAFSHEDIGLVLDQLVEGAALPLAAESMVEKHFTTNPEVGSSGSDASDKDQEPRETNSELLVLEAKSIDDINLAFKQLSQSDPVNLVHPEAGPSEILPCEIHTKLMDVHSDMQIVEATSLEDIHLAMKQLSSALVENPNKSIESKDESSEVMDSQIHLEEEAVTDLDVKRADSGLVGTHSGLQVVEATSLEDIHLVMKQLSAGMVNDPNKSSQGADESSIAKASQMHLEPEVVRHANAEKVNSELLILEAKSIEDISSAFKQVHGDFFDKSVYSEVQPSEALLDRVYVEPVETHSDLQVFEAKSLKDIHLVLRQQSDVQTPAGQLESEVLELQSIQETEAASRTEHVKDSTEV